MYELAVCILLAIIFMGLGAIYNTMENILTELRKLNNKD